MITFKQFITEARMAPLYHPTNLDGLEGMINDGIMKRGFKDTIGHPHSKDGKIISMTRNFTFATMWKSIILQFDQHKLSQRYKIVPFNYFPEEGARVIPRNSKRNYSFTNQFEESVLQDIKDPFKYVTKIYVKNLMQRDHITNRLPEKYKHIPVVLQSEFNRR